MLDKLDMIVDQLERLQNDVNQIKNAIQTVNNNQISSMRGLPKNFQNILDNQLLILKKINE